MKLPKLGGTASPKRNEGEKMILTREQLLKINFGKNEMEVDYYLDALNEILPLYKIDTPLRVSHFLAQVLHESEYLKRKEENFNYSETRLLDVFGKYFSADGGNGYYKAADFARKPEKIANIVYANRMGNGDEASGDGWKYRGRGLIQLTGKDNYRDCGNNLGLDLVRTSDLVTATASNSVTVACWFWSSRSLNAPADRDDIEAITKKINGGLNGLDDRKKILTRAKDYLIGGKQ